MTILAYNLSSNLKSNLQKIETLRRQILLLPIPPKSELRLKWEASLQRVYWSLVLAGNPLGKTEMVKLLSTQVKSRLSAEQKEVVNYKKALDYIKQDWFQRFRNPEFAMRYPEREFWHVQGGFWVLRLAAYDEVGGFAESLYDAPHPNRMDVEYSYYLESRGWRIGNIPSVRCVFHNTLPGIDGYDASVNVYHPLSLERLKEFDTERSKLTCHAQAE